MGTKRRSHNEGSIFQRASDGKWVAMLTLENGRRKAWTGNTRTEVQRKLAAGKRDRDNGLPVAPATQTVAEWITAWLGLMEPPRLEESTHVRYGELLRLHVVPTLGGVRLERLGPQQVQQMYAQALAAGLSSSTVKHIHEVLHNCLEHARRLEVLARNVTDLVDVPRLTRHEMHVLAEEQVRTLLATAQRIGDDWSPLYVLAIATGMRQGELLALKWRDVDLDTGSLQVRTSLRRRRGVYTIKTPKTRRSQRRVALGIESVDALRAHAQAQRAQRQALGEDWTDNDLVFPDETGNELSADRVRWRFKRLIASAGLPAMRFHDLRHTAATLLLGRRVNPKIVSEMLGHASIAITLDIYSHVLPDMQQDAAAVMDAVLRKADG